MAEEPDQPIANEDPEETPGYKAPTMKSVEELEALDADDESLIKYKQTLLAGAGNVQDEGGQNVIVKALVFSPVGHDDIVLDLTGDLAKLKQNKFVVKEGSEFKIKIRFRVQREIVAGLRYHHVTSRKGINVDKTSCMVGSYGPRTEEHEFITPADQAPSGLIYRGTYTIKSKFIDDDKNIFLAWEWGFDIKKDW